MNTAKHSKGTKVLGGENGNNARAIPVGLGRDSLVDENKRNRASGTLSPNGILERSYPKGNRRWG